MFIDNMKISSIFKTMTACVALATFAACEPMEDTWWLKNSLVDVDWSLAGTAQGKRPTGIDSMTINYFSQIRTSDNCSYGFNTDHGEFNVNTGQYDVLVTHNTKFIHNTDKIDEARIIFPTKLNTEGDRVVTEYPDSVMYAGFLYNVPMDYDKQLAIDVQMLRMVKRINFIVLVGDREELSQPCQMDLSGICYDMKLWNMECNETADGIQKFTLTKYGKFYNEDHCLTSYTGYVNCLGTVGRNVLKMRYIDHKGITRFCKFDLTPYLKEWNTKEMTLTLRVLNFADEFDVIGWKESGSSDIEIIY